MKNGIPLAYVLYRATWSVIHIVLVVLAYAAVVAWYIRDGQGAELVTATWESLGDLQSTVSGFIRFPWGD